MINVSNEPIQDYASGTAERRSLLAELRNLLAMSIDIPLRIDGKLISSKRSYDFLVPHDHSQVLGKFQYTDADHSGAAVDAAAAHPAWSKMSL